MTLTHFILIFSEITAESHPNLKIFWNNLFLNRTHTILFYFHTITAHITTHIFTNLLENVKSQHTIFILFHTISKIPLQI
jgi:hypothetical protein